MDCNNCTSSNICTYHIEIATEFAKFGENQQILISEIKEIHSLLMRLAIVEKNVFVLEEELKLIKQELILIKEKLNTNTNQIDFIYKGAGFIVGLATIIALIPVILSIL